MRRSPINLSGKTDGRDGRLHGEQYLPQALRSQYRQRVLGQGRFAAAQDTRGKDLKDPENVRYYLMSGLSHGVGDAAESQRASNFSTESVRIRAHRALLVALDKWVSDGPSRRRVEVPEGGHRALQHDSRCETGVVPQKELGWPTIPGVTYTGVITTRYFLDFGPDFANGILSNYPPRWSGRPSYPIFVSKVDKDGNEIAGVRLPPVEAPIATTTGWALRAGAFGGHDGCESNGQNIPFQTTKAQRQSVGDPRKSLEERYKNHAGTLRR